MNVTRRGFTRMMSGIVAGAVAAFPGLSRPAFGARDPLQSRLTEIEQRLSARLGVAIIDTRTGAEWTHKADERFPMCSTFKVVAVGALLWRVDKGYEELGRRIPLDGSAIVAHSPVTEARVGTDISFAEVCEAALIHSDNTAANMIIDALRGVSGVTQFARSIGDPMTRLDRWATDLNEAVPGDPRDTTTPAAMARTLRALVLGDVLSSQSRELLAKWLVANRTGDARLRAGLPADWRIGDKTGSGGYGTTNDIAVIWPPERGPVIASIYLTETDAPLSDRNAAIAEIGRTLQEALAV